MSLASYVPPRTEVTMLSANPLTVSVRGLNLADIAVLVGDHIVEFRRLAEIWEGAAQEVFASIQKDNFILKLVTEVPSMGATIIALACDEPNNKMQAATLPIAFQVKTLIEIMRLTLEDAGGPKEFAALMQQAIRQVK